MAGELFRNLSEKLPTEGACPRLWCRPLYLKDGGRPEPEAKKDEKKGLADFSVSPLILCGALEQD